MNETAEKYVKLVLAVGQHDDGYVDAYYGPPEWRTEAETAKKPLDAIGRETDALLGTLRPLDVSREEEIIRLRGQYLVKQLEAVRGYVRMLEGEKLPFDTESKVLYDAVSPTHSEEHYKAVLTKLESLLPGNGSVVERYEQFRRDFVIPKEKLDKVFQAAIEEGRKRTKKHVALPENESFVIEYVTDKPWSGYNWYKGNAHSVIQINTDFPIFIDRAVDLACHEGYPGHHVYNLLLEKHLMRERGWVEFSVYPLYSPQSLIAEGSANFGIEVAFPGEERIRFERDVLFPMAGIDPTRATLYYHVQELVAELGHAGNEAARQYLDGKLDREGTIRWLNQYALMSVGRAQQRLKFFDVYRSYVINYNHGQDLVRAFIERRGGTADRPEKRWEEFAKLLASPRLPSGLK